MALDQNALADAETLQGLGGDLASLSADAATRVINEASSACLDYIGRRIVFAAGVVDLVAGFGNFDLRLPQRPIVAVDVAAYVLADGSLSAFPTPADFSVKAASAGILYRRAGWIWTAQRRFGLVQDVWPGTEELRYSFTYAGGYITAPQAYGAGVWPGAVATTPGGSIIRPAARPTQVWQAQQSALLQPCITGALEPAWPAAPLIGTKIADGNFTWIYLGTSGAAGSRGSAASLPWELERACLITATSFSRQNLDDADTDSEGNIGATVKWGRNGIPKSARDMLDRYKVIR